MNAKRLLPLAIAGLALAGAASADAATYCVHQGGSCPGGTIDAGSDLQTALNTAHSTAADDVVHVGPGTWTTPANGFKGFGGPGNGGGAMRIEGAGASTILSGAASPILQAGGIDVSDLAVQIAPGNNNVGIGASGALVVDGVTVSGTGTFHTAVNAWGGVTVRNSTLTTPNGTALYATPTDGQNATLEDSTITAYTTLYVNDAADSGVPAILQRTTSSGGKLDVMANGGHVIVRDAVLRHVSGGAESLAAESNWNHDASLIADHVTIIGDGNGTALHAYGSNGATGTVAVTNSTIRNFGDLTNRTGTNGGSANITLAYSDAHPSENSDSGPGAVTYGPGMVDLADPGFVSNANLRPAASSGLIDAGDPAAPSSATDRDGQPRLSGSRQDIGAYEVQQAVVPVVPAAGDGGATTTPADPAPAGGDAPAQDPAPVIAVPVTASSAAGQPVDIRALLRRAIATAKGHRYTFTWPQGGTVRFVWVRHGHTIGRGKATRTSPGTATVTVKGAKKLPHGARIRASFKPSSGALVRVSVKH